MNREELEKLFNSIENLDNEITKVHCYYGNYIDYLKPIGDNFTNISFNDFKDAFAISTTKEIKLNGYLLLLSRYLVDKKLMTKKWRLFLLELLTIYEDPFCLIAYAKIVEKLPKSRITLAILNTENIEAIMYFINDYPYIDFNIISRWFNENASLDDIITYLKKYPNVSKKVFIDKFIKENNLPSLYKFCLNIPFEEDHNLIEDKIIMSNNVMYMYLFAKDIDWTNKKRLGMAILESYSSKYIYLFTKEFDILPREVVMPYLKRSDDIYYIYLYYKDNFNIPLEIFLKNTSRVAELLIHFSYIDRLMYLIYLYENYKDMDYRKRLHYYKELFKSPNVTIEEAYTADREYDKYRSKLRLAKVRKL